MNLLALKLRGIGVHREDLVVPIEDLGDAQLVAVCGDNGAGKTTALECVPGILYRSTPSRGPLAALANTRDSFVEASFDVAGQVLTARVLIDGVARQPKVEAYLFGADDTPITSGKVRDYIAEIERRFPPADVFLASAFAAQSGEGRFLDLAPAARKELFARLLGLGRLQELSDAAGGRGRAMELRLAELRAKAESLRTAAADIDRLRGAVEDAGGRLGVAVGQRELAEASAVKARSELEAWTAEDARLDRAAIKAQADAVNVRSVALHKKQEVARDEGQLAKVSAGRARLEQRIVKRAEVELRTNIECVDLAALDNEIAEIRAAKDHHAKALAVHADTRHSAVRALDRARSDLTAAARAAAGVDAVPCHGVGEYAGCPLIANATQARGRLDDLRSAVLRAEAGMSAVGPEPTPPDTSRLAELERRRTHATALHLAAERAAAELDAIVEAERQAADLDQEAAALRESLVAGRRKIETLAESVRRAELAAAAAGAAKEAHTAHRPGAPDEAELANLRRSETHAAAELARAEEALAAAERAAAELVTVESLVTTAAADLDDWRHLQTALGRSGIQALEIDAAGPEVSSLTNELLHACYGTRFSVSLETTALKADGTGTKEVFELRVIDTERGVEGSADNLSGGEKVLVSEALALAIAVYNTRRSSVPMLDLFRDECAGALSSANATRYVEMLRRALALGGFHRCYFVAHQPQLWDLADAILLFADGACRLVDEGEVVMRGTAAEEPIKGAA